MISGGDLSTLLYALATGNQERALNIVVTADGIDEQLQGAMWGVLSSEDPAWAKVEALGDLLLGCDADQLLINECYRAAFYLGDRWAAMADNPLYAHFLANRSGAVLDKWIHYFPIYERHLARFQGRPVRVLEIGVYRGGGLRMLESFLGPQARLVGLDIDPIAAQSTAGRYPVELGDQEDPQTLIDLHERHGPFDIVIDDGGHTMRQQIVTAETLFPLINDGGLLLVEDCHTSYWSDYGGGLRDEGSFIEWSKRRVDDLHSRHDSAIDRDSVWATDVDGLHMYDSVVVLEKKRRFRAFNEIAGSSSYLAAARFSELIGVELVSARDTALAEGAALRAELSEVRGVPDGAVVSRDIPPTLEELRVARADLQLARTQLADLSGRMEAQQQELDRTRNQLLESWEHIKQMRKTLSWRVTGPLRAARRLKG